jgi:aminoglycoside phosphotransferase family enzyme/predicted kinase
MAMVEDSAVPPFINALMDPRCYPHAVTRVERIDTHISWVLLAGDYAYKIKKPVAPGFLDFSTLAARHHFCLEELRLNRATAPQLYLEVLPLTGTPAAPRIGGDGAPFEYVLKMRRFAQDDLLDRKAGRGEVDAALIDRLAESVAEFHSRTAVAAPASAHGSPANITQPALDNFDQIAALLPPAAASGLLTQLRAWTTAESIRLEPVFRQRKLDGRVRECHGDLHLGNIAVIDGTPVLFDCIEFNAEFRWIDVISEIAFMVMDLLDRDLAPWAWRCLNRYLEITGDYAGVSVLRYYLVYRALVRAKVALMHAHQPCGDSRQCGDKAGFTHHLNLAGRISKPPQQALILMHGLSGSGKTSVAQVLLERLGAVRLRSDVERKRLHGLHAVVRSGSEVGGGLYAAPVTQETYARLAAAAAGILQAGWPAIVDAASLKKNARDQFRSIAVAAGVPFLIVSCAASEEVLRERLQRRLASGNDASEATPAVLQHQRAIHDAFSADEAGVVMQIDAAGRAAVDIAATVTAAIDAQSSFSKR